MGSIAEELRRLREEDPDVALVLDTFREIDLVYRCALESMGGIYKYKPEVKNSAEVTISSSFTPSSINK